jgi:hypothetical protein
LTHKFERFNYPNHPQCQRGGSFALSTYSRKNER